MSHDWGNLLSDKLEERKEADEGRREEGPERDRASEGNKIQLLELDEWYTDVYITVLSNFQPGFVEQSFNRFRTLKNRAWWSSKDLACL